MPTYDFVCKDCGNRFSLFTTVAGRSKAVCPTCQSNKLEQLFNSMMFVKGGSGAGGSSTAAGGCSRGSCGGCSGC